MEFDDWDGIEGCCSVRCALESGLIDECPACHNSGLVESYWDPRMPDLIDCVEGCTQSDLWVKFFKMGVDQD